MERERCCIAIDLKSFYASAECMSRGLDPTNTNLVVADTSRTEKTICLAVSPSLKAYGVPGRARLFEVIQRVQEVNAMRLTKSRRRSFSGKSCNAAELATDLSLAVDFIAATPRLAYYIELSSKIYDIYLKYVAPEDIHVYSIDEVFIEATDYLKLYGISGRQLAMRMMADVFKATGITATAGIGTNLYLAKIAMDIYAKHVPADENGMRIAELDEMSYRQLLWSHSPITDFWRVGRGYASKLAKVGIYTMGDVARCSVGKPNDFHNEDLLYKLFGINAELLIDHAWGYEPCTMAEIKSYRPESSSVSSGQVLQCPYDFEKGHLVLCEMAEELALGLFEKKMVAEKLVLTVGYDTVNVDSSCFSGQTTIDRYGRRIPKHAHGTVNLPHATSSMQEITAAFSSLYREIVNPALTLRRLTVCADHVSPEANFSEGGCLTSFNSEKEEQLDLFTLLASSDERTASVNRENDRRNEKQIQQALLDIKHKFGKNAIVKGRDLEEGATTMQRNAQIGGHKA